MTGGAAISVLRPASPFKKWLGTRLLGLAGPGLRVLRRLAPIAHFGSTYVVTRHDDVREVFGRDGSFGVPYDKKLQVITDGEPFLLGMADTPHYQASLKALQSVVRADDLPRLAARTEQLATAAVAAAGQSIEVVQFVRDVTFTMLAEYLGVPELPDRRLQAWATRLFEFQFVGSDKDTELRKEVDQIVPALRAHVDAEIAARKRRPKGSDDVLERCLQRQTDGAAGFADADIRTALACLIVGGPPQPPMVVPHALEQLLRRPAALRLAQQAARADDDPQLAKIVLEAMRFDPLAPGLPRTVLKNTVIARGTRRETEVREGATVFAAFASAMMDSRRVPNPGRFSLTRLPHEYIHFGHGLHECFGRHINHATLHLMLKPLLRQPQVRRARGAAGRLLKNGPFAERLVVRLD
ncbi:cytochrome P450 [Sphingomonas sp.]|uniref:cytochrome P450 n=1 Tax=Sphingomonas sp. TaxID=28214 RepID=UPI00286DF5D9|nr:cytochrome P450 [Sphingomonas sp.]